MLRKILRSSVVVMLAMGFCLIGELGSVEGAESLTIYSGRSQKLVDKLFRAFTDETGINVRVRYAKTAALANQLLEEGSQSPADVFFSQDSGALGAVAGQGLLRGLPEDILNKVPVTFRSRNGYWVGLSGRARVLSYSTERLKATELPKSVFDLTKPRWKGRVGLPPTNASFQAFVTAMRVRVGDQKTLAWLKGLVANEVKYYRKNTPTVRAIAAGEIDVGLVNHYYLYRFIRKNGPDFPVRNYYFPHGDIGTLINVAGAGILKSSKKTNAAIKFIRFALSPNGQRIFVKGNNEYPVVKGFKVDSKRGLQNVRNIKTPDVDLSKLTDLRGTVRLLQQADMLPR